MKKRAVKNFGIAVGRSKQTAHSNHFGEVAIF
jgi:hypothetical protein